MEELVSCPTMPVVGEAELRQAWSDQRGSVRYHCAPATFGRVALVEDQEYQRAWVLDLSAGGVGLLLSRPLPMGTLVVIQIKGPSSNKTFELPAHVVHATLQANGGWVVGCELVDRLGEEDLDELLS